MCNACKVAPPEVYNPRTQCITALPDIRLACREGQKDTPLKWLAPKRSAKAELSYQLRRLAGNRQHEVECEVSNV